jgi:hypothetical protein
MYQTVMEQIRRFGFSQFGILFDLVCFGFCVWDFGFDFSEFVSDFDIRISDLFFWGLGAISFLKPVFPLFLLGEFGPLAHSHAGNFRGDCVRTFSCVPPDLFRQIYIPTRHDKRQRAADGTYAHGNRFNR